MSNVPECVDEFMNEIRGRPEFLSAPHTVQAMLEPLGASLYALYRLSHDDPRAVEFCDDVLSIIKSNGPMKRRLLSLRGLLSTASKIYDPNLGTVVH